MKFKFWDKVGPMGNPLNRIIEVYAYEKRNNKTYNFIMEKGGKNTTITSEELTEGVDPSAPFFEILPNECQNLMDALFGAGYRPKDVKKLEGQMEKVERHLSDMRKIVYKKIGIEFND